MAAPKLVLSKNHTPTRIVEFTFERNGKIEVVEKDILNKEDLLTAIQGIEDRNSLIKVVIEDCTDFKRIGSTTFQNFPNLRSITIPKSVTYIEPNAFRGCPKLEEVIFAEKVKRIEVRISHCSKTTFHKPFNGIAEVLRDGYGADLDPDVYSW